jgi:hypothetical protein
LPCTISVLQGRYSGIINSESLGRALTEIESWSGHCVTDLLYIVRPAVNSHVGVYQGVCTFRHRKVALPVIWRPCPIVTIVFCTSCPNRSYLLITGHSTRQCWRKEWPQQDVTIYAKYSVAPSCRLPKFLQEFLVLLGFRKTTSFSVDWVL